MQNDVNNCSAYLDALPGLTPSDNTDGNIRPDGSGLAGAIKNTHIDADELGNINILIDGPVENTEESSVYYDVFITKEDARNKLTVVEIKKNILLLPNHQRSKFNAVIKVADEENTEYANYWLHLPATVCLLARGTYVVYAYKRQNLLEPGTSLLTPSRLLVYKGTVTVKTNPVQGRWVNGKYLETAYRPMAMGDGGVAFLAGAYNPCNGHPDDFIELAEIREYFYTKDISDDRYLQKPNNLSDIIDAAAARTNLDVYSKSEVDGLLPNVEDLDLASYQTKEIPHNSYLNTNTVEGCLNQLAANDEVNASNINTLFQDKQNKLEYYTEDITENISTLSADLTQITGNAIIGGDWKTTPTQLGQKAFRMASKIEADGSNYKVVLTDNAAIVEYNTLNNISYASALNTSSTILSGFSVGDTLSIINDAKCYNSIKIVAINGNGITYSVIQGNPRAENVVVLNEVSSPEFDDYVVFCLSKPTVGTIEIAPVAYSIGAGNSSQGYFGIAIGRENQTYGNFGVTVGRANKAGYASLSGGRACDAYDHGLAYGTYSNAIGKASVALGSYNETLAENSVAMGKYLKVSTVAGVAVGQFNSDSTVTAFCVGGGTSEANRKNILQLDTTGNFKVIGNIFGGGNPNHTDVGNSLLVTNKPVINVANSAVVGNNYIDLSTNTTKQPVWCFGNENEISGKTQTVFVAGYDNTVTDTWNSAVIGQGNVASQYNSFMLGKGLISDTKQGCTVLGIWNDTIPNGNSVTIGAGSGDSNRFNAVHFTRSASTFYNAIHLDTNGTKGIISAVDSSIPTSSSSISPRHIPSTKAVYDALQEIKSAEQTQSVRTESIPANSPTLLNVTSDKDYLELDPDSIDLYNISILFLSGDQMLEKLITFAVDTRGSTPNITSPIIAESITSSSDFNLSLLDIEYKDENDHPNQLIFTVNANLPCTASMRVTKIKY